MGHSSGFPVEPATLEREIVETCGIMCLYTDGDQDDPFAGRALASCTMTRTKTTSEADNPSDKELVTTTLKGDRAAYRKLVERYQGRLFNMALDVVKNREDAEDVIQETFVKAFLSLDKFKGDSSVYTWLYRIAFNMAVDVRRKSARRGGNHVEYKESLGVSRSGTAQNDSQEDLSPLFKSVEGPHEALVRKEAGQKIHQVLSQLSEDHRAVITLREIDGLNYEEISEALNIPRGTVMSRLFYARKALQEALGDFNPTSGPESTSDGSRTERVLDTKSNRLLKSLG